MLRLTFALWLLLLCIVAVLRVGRPPTPVPATAPDTMFSAERAMKHVEQIAARPHAMGMPDHDRVRDYIIGQLNALGLRVQTQKTTAIGTRYQSAGRVENILAWLAGSSSNGKAVLIAVHYDGVAAGPAAGDDGAGSAALLETLRALRARKEPLAHDVIALFTDGEEAGLLGAAAFVREHPWAKDVAVALNFEARGTSGRSFMFETGTGNLDAARALRTAGDVTAGSVFTTVYRVLPNDTDLSELSVLGIPALNFAFADGVERYHTSHDDVAHLNAGSVQHHGLQMLAVTKALASGALPRPVTGDAVFFDLPIIGLVVYPQSVSIELAVVALLLVGVAVWRVRCGVPVGVVAALGAVALSAGAAFIVGQLLHGPAQWSGLFAATVAFMAVAITASCRVLSRRRAGEQGMQAGTLILWLVLLIALTYVAPATTYLFVWPLLFAAFAVLWTKGRMALEAVAAAITILLIVGLAYGVGSVMLGVSGTGAIALAVLASLVALLLAPQLDLVEGNHGAGRLSWLGVIWPSGAAVATIVAALLSVHTNADHPTRTALVYAQQADSADAWLGALGTASDSWTRSAIGPADASAPAWPGRTHGGAQRFAGRRVARVPLDAPDATLARDTVINGARRVVLRLTAPHGTMGLILRTVGTPVSSWSIDDRVVDTSRFRNHRREWVTEYWAPPDTGSILALSIPVGSKLELELAARRPGLPSIPGVNIPARPESVVQSQDGDVSVVFRRRIF